MRSALLEHCLELLAPLGAVRARRMFGGHGLYCDDLFFALIASDRLFLKTDAVTQPAFAAAGCEPFVYRSTPRSPRRGDRRPDGALEDLGLFSRVDIGLQDPDGASASKNVLIYVEEARRYTLKMGLGAEVAGACRLG